MKLFCKHKFYFVFVMYMRVASQPKVDDAGIFYGLDKFCTEMKKIHENVGGNKWDQFPSDVGDDCLYQHIKETWVKEQLKSFVGSTKLNETKSFLFKPKFEEMFSTKPPDDQTFVSVQSAEIWSLRTATSLSKVWVQGLINATWKDSRLDWSKGTTELEKSRADIDLTAVKDSLNAFFQIIIGQNSERRSLIWIPHFADKIASKGASVALNRKISVHKDGTVNMHLAFNELESCEMNFKNFPYDTNNCCITLQPNAIPDKNIHVKVPPNEKITLNHKHGWITHDFDIIKKEIKWDKDSGSLDFCIVIKRVPHSFKYKIVMPIVACALLGIIVPLFTGWKIQVLVKLSTLGLLLLFILTDSSAYLAGIGESDVPSYLIMVDVIMWSTVGSVIITLILWGLSTQAHRVPPSQRMIRFSDAVNRWFCLTGIKEYETRSYIQLRSIIPESEQDTDNIGMRHIENVDNASTVSIMWAKFYLAINNVCLLLVSIILIISVFVLCA